MRGCLSRILNDYLRNRPLLYETLKGQRWMEITLGVTQDSILGPDFWNGYYDSLPDMSEELQLLGYADDVSALIARSTVEQAQS